MRLHRILGVLALALLPRLAGAQAIDDPFSDYLQRSQGINVGAGDANATNEAIQTITPWPWYVQNNRIPLQGRQGVDAIQRMYRNPDPFEQRENGAPVSGAGYAPGSGSGSGLQGTSSLQGTSAPTGLPVTPMQPLSNGE